MSVFVKYGCGKNDENIRKYTASELRISLLSDHPVKGVMISIHASHFVKW